MGRPLRVQQQDAVYFITNRCHQQRFFLVPSRAVNAIILGCLCRAALEHGIVVYGYVFMSNHFHLLVGAPGLNLGEFMRDFQSMLAREINGLRDRTGHFWEGRYKSEHVLDDESMIERMVYMMANPTEAGLVEHPEKWPGVCSWDAHRSGGEVTGQHLLKKEYRRYRQTHPDSDETFEEVRANWEQATFTLQLARLPVWRDVDDDTYVERLRELVDAECDRIRRDRKTRRKDFLGAWGVRAQHWNRRPKTIERSPQPLCHSCDPQKRAEHREMIATVTGLYRRAMKKLREGTPRQKARVSFPHGTYPPGRLCCVGA